jgi:hypothetical protein
VSALRASWEAVQAGGKRGIETPSCLVAVGLAAVLQLVYEKARPDAFPAAADWLITALIMAAFLAAVLTRLAPSVPFRRALLAFAGAQALSTGVLTLVFLVFRAAFLSLLAPLVPAALSALAAFAVLGAPPRSRWQEALALGALYAVTAYAFSYFIALLPGGSTALPATAFFAFMGVFAAAAPASLEAR